jgi:hypothetical protein
MEEVQERPLGRAMNDFAPDEPWHCTHESETHLARLTQEARVLDGIRSNEARSLWRHGSLAGKREQVTGRTRPSEIYSQTKLPSKHTYLQHENMHAKHTQPN